MKHIYSVVHYLSNEHPLNVYTTFNRSRVTVGFVRTVACAPLENVTGKKRTKKWETCSMFKSMGGVRGQVFASFTIKKKYTTSEHVEIKRVSK